MNTKNNTISAKDIGKSLSIARASAGYSQAEFAEQLSVSQRTVSSYETGQRRIHAALLFKVARLLNISLDNIAGLSFNKIDGRTRFSSAMKELEQMAPEEQKAVFTMIQTISGKYAH